MGDTEPKRINSTSDQVCVSTKPRNPRERKGSRWGSSGGEGVSEHGRGTERDLRLAKEGGIPSHKMVAPTHLGARHTPLGAPRRQLELGPRPGRPAWACAAEAPAERPASLPSGARGRSRRGAGPEVGLGSLGLSPKPPPGTDGTLTSDSRPEPGKGGGAAGMNGEGGCSLAMPHRSRAAQLAAARALATASPLPRAPKSQSAGRPQPTVPSAGVTHSRRSASSLCSRAHRESPRPPARSRRAAPPRRR